MLRKGEKSFSLGVSMLPRFRRKGKSGKVFAVKILENVRGNFNPTILNFFHILSLKVCGSRARRGSYTFFVKIRRK